MKTAAEVNLQKIMDLREKLEETVARAGALTDPEVLFISSLLDAALNEYYRSAGGNASRKG
ncbi:hypothetical protein Tfer_0778 [Thermincola ferriacetica]|uniref:Sporulation stage 0, Spo0E-like regulatory phosphatase n=1 Tax=Thermincola ferriacetica TaxID=281456 RepID=A0A0L6W661_9FIRM|nr:MULTISPECIES: aspartyl-phosphate phosphatase Spo0E family protein [Thermincola]KNZ70594.1 hypothetical protein Tfer_0778 [Thermincola ferriacetica]